MEKWGVGVEEQAIVRRQGKGERDQTEFFGSGQLLTRGGAGAGRIQEECPESALGLDRELAGGGSAGT